MLTFSAFSLFDYLGFGHVDKFAGAVTCVCSGGTAVPCKSVAFIVFGINIHKVAFKLDPVTAAYFKDCTFHAVISGDYVVV